MNRIPFVNPTILDDDILFTKKALLTGRVSNGKYTEDFEHALCEKLDVNHSIVVNSGTSAIHLALASLDIKKADEVILPALTYIATINAILYLGALPVICDINEVTHEIDFGDIVKKISKNTKAIILVDLYGKPSDYDSYLNIGNQYGIPIIADSAQAFGATYKNKIIGSQVFIHAFSFSASKTITTGEGGAMTTNNPEIAQKARILKNQGQENRYEHKLLGYNFRISEMQAALGLSQLGQLEKFISDRNEIAKFYTQGLSGKSEIQILNIPDYVSRCVWNMFSIQFDNEKQRNKVVENLNENGIESRICFPPLHLQPIVVKKTGKGHSKPIAEKLFRRKIELPIWPGMKESDVSRICGIIMRCVQQKSQYRLSNMEHE